MTIGSFHPFILCSLLFFSKPNVYDVKNDRKEKLARKASHDEAWNDMSCDQDDYCVHDNREEAERDDVDREREDRNDWLHQEVEEREDD